VPDSTDDALLLFQAQILIELLRHNDATANRLLAAYAELYRELSSKWQAVLREVTEAQRSGDVTALNLLALRSQRIHALRVQTAEQVNRFALQAEIDATADQAVGLRLGQEHAARLVRRSLTQTAPGLDHTFVQLPAGALEQMVGKFSSGAPLRTLFSEFGPDAASGAEDVLFRSVAMGLHPRLAAEQLNVKLGVPLTRALVISRTETISAYRNSTLEAYRRNDDVVKAWRWNAHLGARTCSSCIALHGTVHALSEAFRDHPSGRCTPSPVTVTWAELGRRGIRGSRPEPTRGPDWFAEQDEAIQLRVLGPGKLALYQAGDIDLEDLVTEQVSTRWGNSFREGSIQQALAAHGQEKPWQRYRP